MDGSLELRSRHCASAAHRRGLTQTGERKWRSVNDDVLELEERLLLGLTRDEVRALNRSLQTIIRNMTPTP
jgi:DNA-binding MarR family transcriptional regulator